MDQSYYLITLLTKALKSKLAKISKNTNKANIKYIKKDK